MPTPQARTILDDLTVVIPTLGRPTLFDTLESIAAGSHWPASIVVSQQGTESSPVQWIRSLRDRGMVVHHEHHPDERGVAQGRNRGIARVTTRFLALTDDDCRVAPDWATSMARLLTEHDCVIVGSVHPEGEGTVPSVTTRSEPRVVTEPTLGPEPFFPNNAGYPKRVADEIGGYDTDPRIRFAEDGDYSHRILRGGVPIRYEPDVKVSHVAWRDQAELDRVFARYAWCAGAVYGKWIRRGDTHMAMRAARDIARIPWWLLKGTATNNRELVDMGRHYARHLVPGIAGGLRREMHEADISVLV